MQQKMRVYYAHPVSLYGTKQEARDVATLEGLGFQVINPNGPQHQIGYEEGGMDYFTRIVQACDAVAFRAFPDGSIGAGIAKEVRAAEGKPVIELPSRVGGRALSVDDTREVLTEMGVR